MRNREKMKKTGRYYNARWTELLLPFQILYEVQCVYGEITGMHIFRLNTTFMNFIHAKRHWILNNLALVSIEVLSITVSHWAECLLWMLHFSENQSHTGHTTFLFASEYVCLDVQQVIKLFFPVFKKKKERQRMPLEFKVSLIWFTSQLLIWEKFSLPKRSWPH